MRHYVFACLAGAEPLRASGGSIGNGATPPSPGPALGTGLENGLGRILVVEDDAFIGMEIEDILSNAGYKVVEIAVSAEEAVRAALEGFPDLVLMDIRLVGPRDGIDAAVEIRRKADIPCLFISAHADPAVRARAEAARPAGWIQKPFSPPELLATVAQALGRRSGGT